VYREWDDCRTAPATGCAPPVDLEAVGRDKKEPPIQYQGLEEISPALADVP
jgi:hypothetical protein